MLSTHYREYVMQKKLSTLALLCLVAVVAFLAGTMYSSATATTANSGKKYIGVTTVNARDGSVIIFAVYETPMGCDYEKVKTFY